MQDSATLLGILDMLNDGYSYRDIIARYNCGNSLIITTKRKFEELDYSLQELHSMDSKGIQKLFYPPKRKEEYPLPDFRKVYDAITDRKRKVNLYFLWLAYKKVHPDGYQYTQFKKYFKDWLDDNHLEMNLSMVVERIPGEIVYIDWVGDTLPLVLDEETGVLKDAHFFTTTVGVSSYCFVEAFPNEKTEHFLKGTIDSMEFYGGVPKILKPDNTKAAVIKNDKDVLILNKVYEDLQESYGCVIVPAPSRKPKGKSTVENHVGYIETHLLERLRGRFFTSFNDLNMEIGVIMDEINERKFQKGKGSRKSMFEEYDKPAMKPLPKDSLKYFTYHIKTVPSNYHIEYDNHYYSVPYFYYKQEVTLKVSTFSIKICDSMNKLIYEHERSYKSFPKYITVKEHMPEKHQYYFIENRYTSKEYLEWASRIGSEMNRFISMVIHNFQYEEQSYKSVNGILHSCKDVPYSLANEAARLCIENHTIGYSYYKKQLNELNRQGTANTHGLPEHKNIRGKDKYK